MGTRSLRQNKEKRPICFGRWASLYLAAVQLLLSCAAYLLIVFPLSKLFRKCSARDGRPPGVIVQRLFTSVRMFDPSAYS